MRPVFAAMTGLLCLVSVSCSQVSTEGASLQAAPQVEPQLEAFPEVSESLPAADGSGSETVEDDDESSSDSSSPDSVDSDRGSRTGADEDFEPAPAPTAAAAPTPTPVPTTAPVATPEPTLDESATASEVETNADADTGDDAQEPTPTSTPAPVANPPAQAPAPTATSVPVSTQDPEPVFIAPTPTGPVPSDEIVVQGPTVDESEASDISVSGASACALAESAIDFLDRGDLAGTAAVLVESSQVAAQASESSITSVTSQLANAGPNEDAAIAAIIAMLNACAQHGYQV